MVTPGEAVIPRQYIDPVTAASISLPAILGIAIGGAVALFGILAFVGIYFVRRNDRNKREQWRSSHPAFTENKELASRIRSHRIRGTSMSHRSSYIPFFPPHQCTEAILLTTEQREDSPPVIRAKSKKRRSPRKMFARFSRGIRDSWPLASSMQMPNPLRQTQSTVTVNQIAPPGYLVPPERPQRTYSRAPRNPKNKVLVLAEGSNRPEPPSPSPRPRLQRRVASENHLSTILRSTSERLKDTHRRSLSRTLTAIGRNPDSAPIEKLPLPKNRAAESREALIDRQVSDYRQPSETGSQISELFFTRTPSPAKKAAMLARAKSQRRASTPTPSPESEDSLCAVDTPDLVIPAPLTSPSKYGSREDLRLTMDLSSLPCKDISTMIQRGSRASVLALGRQDSDVIDLSLSTPHRITLASDPFYSEVTNVKTVTPVSLPRPLYIRKATFGQEATSRPPSVVSISTPSPLKDISGNRQTPPKTGNSPQSSPHIPQQPAPNPFQFSPQEALRNRSTSSNKPEQNHKRGHKRSKVVRMTNLNRTSSFLTVPEEPEQDSPPVTYKFPKPGLRMVEPSHSPSPAPPSLSRSLNVHPPSSPVFDPCVSVPMLVAGKTTDSPTLGLEIYSPTLAVTNYYNSPTSEDEFFNTRKLSPVTTRKRREAGISPVLSPTTKLEDMISYPLQVENKKPRSPALSPNSEILKALEGRKSPPPSVSPAVPAPPVLTIPVKGAIPIPGHLTGPRAEPKRHSSQRLPQRNSLRQSIGMLRRMNSQISTYDSPSSVYSNSSVSPLHRKHSFIRDTKGLSPSPSPIGRKNSTRGSRHYLAMGTQSRTPTKQNQRGRVEKRDSRKMTRERQLQRDNSTIPSMSSLTSDDEFTPVRETTSSPATSADGIEIAGLKFPILSHLGPTTSSTKLTASPKIGYPLNKMESTNKPKPKPHTSLALNSPRQESRWSDAMQKRPVKVARHEPKLAHPSAASPPNWGWGRESKISLVTSAVADIHVTTSREQENVLNKQGNRSPARSDGGGGVSPEEIVLPDLGSGKSGLGGGNGGGEKAAGGVGKRGTVWGYWNRNNGRPDSLGLYDEDGFLRSSPATPAR